MIFLPTSKWFLSQYGMTFGYTGKRERFWAFGEKPAGSTSFGPSFSLPLKFCDGVCGYGVCACVFWWQGVPLCAFLSTPCIFAQTEPQVTSTEEKKELAVAQLVVILMWRSTKAWNTVLLFHTLPETIKSFLFFFSLDNCGCQFYSFFFFFLG